MEILMDVLLLLHLVGMAIIVGGYFTVIRSPRVVPGMLHASYLQLVTGLAMVGIAEATWDVGTGFHVFVGIKLVLGILVTVFAFLGNKKQKTAAAALAPGAEAPAGPAASASMAHLMFGAAIIAVVVAAFEGLLFG